MTQERATAEEREDPAVDGRLADLAIVGGSDLVQRLLSRFESHLIESLAGREADGTWPPGRVHRTLGSAGMLGFVRLETACRNVERAAPPTPPLYRRLDAAAREALGEIRKRLV